MDCAATAFWSAEESERFLRMESASVLIADGRSFSPDCAFSAVGCTFCLFGAAGKFVVVDVAGQKKREKSQRRQRLPCTAHLIRHCGEPGCGFCSDGRRRLQRPATFVGIEVGDQFGDALITQVYIT